MSRQSRPQEPSTGSLRRRAGQATLATEVSWALTHVHLLEKALGTADVTDIARRHDVPPDVLRPGIPDIADAGWLALDGTRVTLTPAGVSSNWTSCARPGAAGWTASSASGVSTRGRTGTASTGPSTGSPTTSWPARRPS
jgi:hypothetical protein